MDHIHYNERLNLVSSIVQESLFLQVSHLCTNACISFAGTYSSGWHLLEPVNIHTIEYYEHCPFPFNNFIYRVDVAPLSESPLPSNRSLKPGTGELPLDTSTVVVRLTNSAADGMNNHNRVENEVATMGLLRDALDPVEKHLVPHVYDWHTTGTGGQGWTVQEFMPGSSPDQVFADLSLHDKTVLISQIALVVKALQNIKLPGSVSGYGGLSFDDQGAIISSQMTLLSGGPFPAFETLMSHVLRAALNDADKSPILQGWRHIDLRSRIEAFIATGIPKVLQNNAKEMVLVQGDLSKFLLYHTRGLVCLAIHTFIKFSNFLKSSSSQQFTFRQRVLATHCNP